MNGKKTTVKVGRRTITGLLQEWQADWGCEPFGMITLKLVVGTKHLKRFIRSKP